MPFVNGHAHWPPALQHVAFGDPVAGLYCAAAAMAALWARERLGGAEIELCQVECLFQMGAEGIIGEQARGSPSPRTGSARATARLSTVVATAVEDAWLAVVAETDAQLAALQSVVGAEGEGALAAWAAEQWGPDAAATLQAAGVPAAPVNLSSDMAADPHLGEAEFWVIQHRRHLGEHMTPAAPMRFDGERPPVVRPAPVLGEHTDEVLAELKAMQPA
jgi:crotonobetainyl-CoA:carnitine CoA-transferase CaiB-like acyl-CoA transferase